MQNSELKNGDVVFYTTTNQVGIVSDVGISLLKFRYIDDCGVYHSSYAHIDKLERAELVIDGEPVSKNVIIVFKGNDTCYYAVMDEDKYVKCTDCYKWFSKDDVIEIDGEYVCEKCVDTYYLTCSECGKIERKNYPQYAFGLCRSCFDDARDNGKIINCERCGEYFWDDSDSIHYYEDCYQHLCNDCRNDYENEQYTSGVTDYSFKPTPVFHHTDNQTREENLHIGFELEVDADDDDDLADCDCSADRTMSILDFVYCKHDCSLDYGYEIVSHPATYEWLESRKDIMAKAFKSILNDGYTSHNVGTCGLHFHCDRAFLGGDYGRTVTNLRIFINGFFEKVMDISRRGNGSNRDRWCHRQEGFPYQTDMSYERVKSLHKPDSRYYAINLENANTVEFRFFRGTLNIETFFSSLRFINELCYVAKTIPEDEVCSYDKWLEKFSQETRTFIANHGKTTVTNHQENQ